MIYLGELQIKPDLVVITGDLTEWALPDEFKMAQKFIMDLMKALNLPMTRVAVVPGNHDINRKLCESYFNECSGNGKKPQLPYVKKWEPWINFFKSLYKGVANVTFTVKAPWTLFVIDDLKLIIAGLNATWKESHQDSDHYGHCGEQQYHWFKDKIGQYRRDGWWCIGAIHHNPIRGATDDDENLRDVDDLTQWIGPDLDLLLHGHTHSTGENMLNTLPVFATGSAGLKATARPGEVPNQYQVLFIDSSGVGRWARCYAPDRKMWIGDTRISPYGNKWQVKTIITFKGSVGTRVSPDWKAEEVNNKLPPIGDSVLGPTTHTQIGSENGNKIHAHTQIGSENENKTRTVTQQNSSDKSQSFKRDTDRLFEKLKGEIVSTLASSSNAMAKLDDVMKNCETKLIPNSRQARLMACLLDKNFETGKDILLQTHTSLRNIGDKAGSLVIEKVSRLLIPWLYVLRSDYCQELDREWDQRCVQGDVVSIPAGITSFAEIIMAGLYRREVIWNSIKNNQGKIIQFPEGQFSSGSFNFLQQPANGILSEDDRMKNFREDLYKRIEVPSGTCKLTPSVQNESIRIQLRFLRDQKDSVIYYVYDRIQDNPDDEKIQKDSIVQIRKEFPEVVFIELNRELHPRDQKLFNEIYTLIVTEDS
ncbi:MAG: metallophosphoesterase [Magnetococcales bacterium]|nr:metallophosphoesterase [Magnetococcales bacterium]